MRDRLGPWSLLDDSKNFPVSEEDVDFYDLTDFQIDESEIGDHNDEE